MIANGLVLKAPFQQLSVILGGGTTFKKVGPNGITSPSEVNGVASEGCMLGPEPLPTMTVKPQAQRQQGQVTTGKL